ncbi:hypothetical protein JCM3774_005768 [Rhodotorula dairenensis]
MSKYATLPDIDTGADVFETPDVPAEISHSLDSDSDDEFRLPRTGSPTTSRRAQRGAQLDPESEDIDADHLDAVEARRRFGAASLAALRRNEREATHRLPVRRPLPSATVYTAGPDPDDHETPLERLRRLRLEVTELEEEVRRTEAERGSLPSAPVCAADDTTDSPTAKTKQKREVSPAVLLQQLQFLRNDLQGIGPRVEGVLEADGELASSPDASPAGGPLTRKAAATSKLLRELESPVPSGAEAPGDRPVGTEGTGSTGPERTREPSDSEVEKRVSALEAFLGASEADVDEVPTSLVQTVSRLDHLLTLLTQPRHLDSISRRVKVLVSDLERIHESRRKLGDTRPLNVALSGGMTLSTGQDGSGSTTKAPPSGAGNAAGSLPPDALQKIDALFALLPRIDPLLPLAPRLVTRLRSLANLHASAASFGESLAELKNQVEELDEGEQGLREVVHGLEKSFEENEARVKGNLEAMDERVEEVLKRLDRLSA